MPLKSKQNTKRKPALSTVLDEYSVPAIKRYLRNKEADKERAAELRLSPLTDKEVRKTKVGYGRDIKKMDKKRKNNVMSNYMAKKKKKK